MSTYPIFDIMTNEKTKLKDIITKASFQKLDIDPNEAFAFVCDYSFFNYYTDVDNSIITADIYRRMITEKLEQLENQSHSLIKSLEVSESFYTNLILFLTEKVTEIMSGSPLYRNYLSNIIEYDDSTLLQKVVLRLSLLLAPNNDTDCDVLWIITTKGLKRQSVEDEFTTSVKLEQFNNIDYKR